MKLYIDGDAFPNLLKPILLKAIQRLSLPTIVVANRDISFGKSKYITKIIVSSGADEADHRIVELMEAEDLVITADIPLADRVISKKGYALDHRGKFFTADNIKQSLAIRNLMHDIRESGEITKGPPPFGKKDVQNFVNKLDQFLTKALKT